MEAEFSLFFVVTTHPIAQKLVRKYFLAQSPAIQAVRSDPLSRALYPLILRAGIGHEVAAIDFTPFLWVCIPSLLLALHESPPSLQETDREPPSKDDFCR